MLCRLLQHSWDLFRYRRPIWRQGQRKSYRQNDLEFGGCFITLNVSGVTGLVVGKFRRTQSMSTAG